MFVVGFTNWEILKLIVETIPERPSGGAAPGEFDFENADRVVRRRGERAAAIKF